LESPNKIVTEVEALEYRGGGNTASRAISEGPKMNKDWARTKDSLGIRFFDPELEANLLHHYYEEDPETERTVNCSRSKDPRLRKGSKVHGEGHPCGASEKGVNTETSPKGPEKLRGRARSRIFALY